MKYLLLASLITLLAFGTACGQAAEPAPEPAASNGIQVHGHWTVTVTNPDGTLDAVHEFDNELTLSGSGNLAGLLANETPIQSWLIHISTNLSGTADMMTCEQNTSTISLINLPAQIFKQTNAAGHWVEITAECRVQGISASEASSNPTIKFVKTFAKACPQDDTPCYKAFSLYIGSFMASLETLRFTEHVLEDPIPVSDNQLLSFKVVIGFS